MTSKTPPVRRAPDTSASHGARPRRGSLPAHATVDDRHDSDQLPAWHRPDLGSREVDQSSIHRLQARATDPNTALSDLDLHVLHLSMKDGRDTADTSRHLVPWTGATGGAARKRLANPRLEALRRYAVQFRSSGGSPTTDERASILAAGYSDAQVRGADDFLHQLQPDLVARRSPRRPRGIVVAVGAFSLAICIWLARVFENGAVAMIVFGLMAVTIASFFVRSPR